MAKRLRLIGVEKVMKNLNREVKKIKALSMQGLIQAAIVIHRDTDLSTPKIPVDTGNLRASRFTTTGYGDRAGGGDFTGDDAGRMSADHSTVVSKASGQVKSSLKNRPILILGYSAHYAAAVHEAAGKKEWKRGGSGPKYLETSLENNKRTIIQAIKLNNAKLK